MKKYEDFSEDNAFFEEKREIIEMPDLEASLIPSEREIAEDKKVRFFSLTILMVLAAAAITCILIFLVASRGEENIPAIDEVGESEEWRGAFGARDIYEQRVSGSVLLRRGEYGAQRIWSGFLLTSDGWIATSAQAAEQTAKGRVYAELCDGREYSVEKIMIAGEVALLKISAEGLDAATFGEAELQSGEGVISVCANGDILSGQVSNADSLKLDMSFTRRWEGSPVYDDRGELVGMVCSDDDGSVRIVPAESIKSALFKIK